MDRKRVSEEGNREIINGMARVREVLIMSTLQSYVECLARGDESYRFRRQVDGKWMAQSEYIKYGGMIEMLPLIIAM